MLLVETLYGNICIKRIFAFICSSHPFAVDNVDDSGKLANIRAVVDEDNPANFYESRERHCRKPIKGNDSVPYAVNYPHHTVVKKDRAAERPKKCF